MSTVLVFGTFDRLHDGHRSFLRAASRLADELVVCLPEDVTVERLKGRLPGEPFDTRARALRELPQVTTVVRGDNEPGVYSAISQIRPDVVAFGYDQAALREDFLAWQNKVGDKTFTQILAAHKPEVYKTSLLPKL